MPLWRCPHCGIPQVESSRCWVCRRSTTSCAACRHFRRGIASGLGVCGLDPRRLALRGTEMRACWEAADTTGILEPPDDPPSTPVRVPVMAASAPGLDEGSGGQPVRTFVPVAALVGAPGRAISSIGPDVPDADGDGDGELRPVAVSAARRIPGGWSLWGDLDA